MTLTPHYQDEHVTIWNGDCLDVLRELPDASVDAVVTDPPYGLANTNPQHVADTLVRWVNGDRDYIPTGAGFMGKAWDAFVPPVAVWDECMRVLKPGGYLLSFAGTRTVDLMTLGLRLAGFDIRDSIAWLYGSGFPKSKNLDGDWRGWGTALKPSFEPIVVARKPFAGTVAANVLTHGTGALNIDACRTPAVEPLVRAAVRRDDNQVYGNGLGAGSQAEPVGGRWPANVVLDDDQAAALDEQTGVSRSRVGKPRSAASGSGWGMTSTGAEYDDQGGASRFFPVFRYEAKASTLERPRAGDIMHPTVKPLDLMRWLVRLVTPPGGVVLEPFAGSGTTAEACVIEGFRCIAIEREADYLPLIVQRLQRRDVTAPATVELMPGALQDGFDFGEVQA